MDGFFPPTLGEQRPDSAGGNVYRFPTFMEHPGKLTSNSTIYIYIYEYIYIDVKRGNVSSCFIPLPPRGAWDECPPET